ncbi:hypothetical protein [Mucilaginibacter sp.]|uniref:hypothetical protein n=1 Tax=Mucilaginibacter sp. TaxID=1882438 RepID=UPI0025E4C482|nr:hypothetical protein [Mucilaginibacter sp.]
MPKEKITIDDIGFLVNRLTTALEKFSAQIQKADLSDPPTKVKKETEEDIKIKQFYSLVGKYSTFITEEERDKYTNPTPSEFSKLKRIYKKSQKDIRKRKAHEAASEVSQLTQIAIEAPVTSPPFNEADLTEGRIIVTGYYKNHEGSVGLIGKVGPQNKFPLEIYVCKKDFTPGKRRYVIEVPELVLAIIDPGNKSFFLTTYLIGLAVKYSTYFKGLIYLKKFSD